MESMAYWQVLEDTAPLYIPEGLSLHQMEQFKALYKLVTQANATMNLTRITDLPDFIARHLLDSLTVAPLLKPGMSVMDVGSGAGFPALPLAIIFPGCPITAVESVQKKARFIEEAAKALQLSNVTVVAQRSEDLGQSPQYREQFDVVVARAVAGLNILAELCLPCVKLGGRMIAMKTTDTLNKELPEAKQAIVLLGGRLGEIKEFSTELLPNRAIICVDKMKPTPSQYPRKAGLPAKKPLFV